MRFDRIRLTLAATGAAAALGGCSAHMDLYNPTYRFTTTKGVFNAGHTHHSGMSGPSLVAGDAVAFSIALAGGYQTHDRASPLMPQPAVFTAAPTTGADD